MPHPAPGKQETDPMREQKHDSPHSNPRKPGTGLRRSAALAALALVALAPHAQAADNGLPDGPIRLVVGFAPGGAADLTARVFAEQLSKVGANIVVENKPGASTQIANNYARRADPDGKTLLLVTSAAFTVHPSAYSHLDYDVDKDFRPIASLVDIPLAMVTGIDQPYNNIKEYAAWAKQHPDDATVGVATLGGLSHLGSIGISQAIGVKFESVIYKGASPMLVDTVSNRVSAAADAAASMIPLYQSKKIKFLGLSGSERLSSLPDVPTVKEQGYSQFEKATSFYAVYAPAGVPDKIAAAWEKAFMEAAKDPAVIKKMLENGAIVRPLDHEQLAQRIHAERQAWAPIIKAYNIKLD